jgi:hypothetical protein
MIARDQIAVAATGKPGARLLARILLLRRP